MTESILVTASPKWKSNISALGLLTSTTWNHTKTMDKMIGFSAISKAMNWTYFYCKKQGSTGPSYLENTNGWKEQKNTSNQGLSEQKWVSISTTHLATRANGEEPESALMGN